MKFYVKTKLSENISETPEGFLLCVKVPLTHTGALKYVHPEHPFGEEAGEVTIKRKPEDLFSKETMASFEGKDITISHPEDFVNPDNYKELTNGTMFNVRKSSEKINVEGEEVEVLIADFLIKSSEAIEMVKNGEREVSLGYDAMWELVGDSEGTHSKIIGNHCALVSQGRAGKHCAINDHKKGESIMGLKEINDKLKKLFGKTADEMIEEKEKESKDEEEDKDKLIKDLKEKVKDLEAKCSKDEDKEKEESKDEEEEEKSKDEEGESSSLEDRLKKLEGMVSKLMESISQENSDADESEIVVGDEEEEESEDGYEGGKEEKGNDEMSRAEILSPGIKKSKEIRKEALAKAYATKDGKVIIDSLTGGKELSKLSKEAEKAIFIAASEMMKAKRVKDQASTKMVTIDSFPNLKNVTKTPDDINKLNAAHYGKK